MNVCCAFYLAWWIIAFRPDDLIKGLRSGWLLLPAAVAGFTGVYYIVRGTGMADASAGLISSKYLLSGGIIAYFLLLAVTYLVFHRMVTTELALIVGWTVLTIMEVSNLYSGEYLDIRWQQLFWL